MRSKLSRLSALGLVVLFAGCCLFDNGDPVDPVVPTLDIQISNEVFSPSLGEKATISITVNSITTARVTVTSFDESSSWELFEGDLTVGSTDIDWTGKDDQGDSVTPGIYLVLIESSICVAKERVIVKGS